MRKKHNFKPAVLAAILLAGWAAALPGKNPMDKEPIPLPKPEFKGRLSVAESIQRRRSIRSYQDKTLTLEEASRIAWSAQGVTEKNGSKRAAPSAGATYPLFLYLVTGGQTCAGLPAGVYRYLPERHALTPHLGGDKRKALAAAALHQDWFAQAPVILVIAADYRRTADRYGQRARRYVHMEAGHAGQNIYLQAEALGLGTCAVGAFKDGEVASALALPEHHAPLYILPIGHPR